MQSLSSFRKPPSNKSMGIEIEGFCDYDSDKIVTVGAYHGFFFATSDGSIMPSWHHEGFELVSQPLTPSWLIKEIKSLPFEWETNDTCGIHIHVSRKWLSKKRAGIIAEWICALSKEEYEILFGRRPNSYCRQIVGTSRYCAVNTTNQDTIEFRMFASGGKEWACYCVRMVEWLINQAHVLNLDAAYAFRDSFKEI